MSKGIHIDIVIACLLPAQTFEKWDTNEARLHKITNYKLKR